jgi:hypothetical protein
VRCSGRSRICNISFAQTNCCHAIVCCVKARDGDRAKMLFQFLNEIGARALRIQLGRVLEMAESSRDKFTYENKIAERFGGQKELELVCAHPPASLRQKRKRPPTEAALLFIPPSTQQECLTRSMLRSRLLLNIG